MADFHINVALLCDDIRKEVTNKDILIGVYGGGIIVSSVPVVVPIAVWLEVMPLKLGRLSIDLGIKAPGDIPLFPMTIVLDIVDLENPLSISTPQIQMPVTADGTIDVLVRANDTEEWQVIKRKTVRVGKFIPAIPMEILQGAPPLPERASGNVCIGSKATSPSPTTSPPLSEQSPPDVPASMPRLGRRRPSTRRTGRNPELE